jgi:deferrochelatase/peroxidase EfeB
MSMAVQLDLADIQGNVLTAYGRLGFPKGRFLLLNIADARAGRTLLDMLRPYVTTALRWPSSKDKEPPPGTVFQRRPQVAVNVAFTFWGLLALGVPIRTLRGMPDEFIDGMPARADILCDNFPKHIEEAWDPVWLWRDDPKRRVHVLLTLNAQMQDDGTPVERLDGVTREILGFIHAMQGKVTLLSGHRGTDERWQDLSALLGTLPDGTKTPLPSEHFGFVDAIGDPVFEGQHEPDKMAARVVGQGKLLPDQSWAPLAAGEFLLGHPDESQEIAGGPMPLDFARNGTFIAYRKLHQNVAAFRDAMDRMAVTFAKVMQVGQEEACETLKAKIAGRWSDGVPLISAPTYPEWRAVQARRVAAAKAGDRATLAALDRALVDFTFRDDPLGAKCPFGSHLRRSNTRDMMDPLLTSADPKKWGGSVLNNRRRLLRRGLPYGEAAPGATVDDQEHGIVMLATCASLFRQFEFVQQQWMQYGLDFNTGNDTCPIVGNHGEDAKFVIAADPASGKPPFICDRLPQFVETRGGEYFFVPSMTALRMIAAGIVDPT